VRYTQLTSDDGGTLDDLMVTRSHDPQDDGRLYLVVNASRKREDYAHIAGRLPADVQLGLVEDRALIALQGPAAEAVIAPLSPEAAKLRFMRARSSDLDGIGCHIARSGYTGEDGFEISVAADKAAAVWDRLLQDGHVKPVGLGARDSLRLEAGLCLYGNDLDETISPVEAGLAWSIQKRRREEGGFPGAKRILREIAEGPQRKRVGIRPSDRTPARHGAAIETPEGRPIGTVTSGGFGPTVGGPIAMGLIEAGLAAEGREIVLKVRGRPVAAKIVPLPFVPARYRR
jgi:aminomethyltransferase